MDEREPLRDVDAHVMYVCRRYVAKLKPMVQSGFIYIHLCSIHCRDERRGGRGLPVDSCLVRLVFFYRCFCTLRYEQRLQELLVTLFAISHGVHLAWRFIADATIEDYYVYYFILYLDLSAMYCWMDGKNEIIIKIAQLDVEGT